MEDPGAANMVLGLVGELTARGVTCKLLASDYAATHLESKKEIPFEKKQLLLGDIQCVINKTEQNSYIDYVIERKTISREMYRNKIKTYVKKLESLITEKDQKSAMELLKKVDPKLQASKNKNIFSKAKISRIQKRLNSRIVQLKKK